MITIICAYTKRHRIIGKNGTIPWKIPEELEHFKKTTMGGAIIFGRITFEGIGRALPGRLNVVISRTKAFEGESLLTAGSIEEAVEQCKLKGYEQIFICGGEKVYLSAISKNLCTKMILSEINEDYCEELTGADRFFPEIPEDFTETKRTANEKFTILEFTRKDCLY